MPVGFNIYTFLVRFCSLFCQACLRKAFSPGLGGREVVANVNILEQVVCAIFEAAYEILSVAGID